MRSVLSVPYLKRTASLKSVLSSVAPFSYSGVVVYNHMKLQMIKSKVAATSSGKPDEEKPKEERWVIVAT